MSQYFSTHKIIAFIVVFTSFHFLASQNTRIVYGYKSARTADEAKKNKEKFKKNGDNHFHDELMDTEEMFKDSLKFELIYNVKESLFRISEKPHIEDAEMVPSMLLAAIYGPILSYKSKHVKYSIRESLTSKTLKVTYPVNYFKWKLTKKTKEILGYPCKLAVSDYKDIEGNESKVYAWFTEKLPYAYGPQGFDNLPGVILETLKGIVLLTAESIKKSEVFPTIKTPEKRTTITKYIKKNKKFKEDSMKYLKRKRK